MAEDNDAASKTEEPSQRKLDQARERGEVLDLDLAPLAALTAAAPVIALSGGTLSKNLAMALLPFLAHPDQMHLEGGGGRHRPAGDYGRRPDPGRGVAQPPARRARRGT